MWGTNYEYVDFVHGKIRKENEYIEMVGEVYTVAKL